MQRARIPERCDFDEDWYRGGFGQARRWRTNVPNQPALHGSPAILGRGCQIGYGGPTLVRVTCCPLLFVMFYLPGCVEYSARCFECSRRRQGKRCRFVVAASRDILVGICHYVQSVVGFVAVRIELACLAREGVSRLHSDDAFTFQPPTVHWESAVRATSARTKP